MTGVAPNILFMTIIESTGAPGVELVVDLQDPSIYYCESIMEASATGCVSARYQLAFHWSIYEP